MRKRQINDDIFTRPEEAVVRSYDLGFEGEIHTHETADGQRTWMPGPDHDAYLGRVAEPEESPDDVSTNQGLLERAIAAIMHGIMEYDVTKHAEIIKTDEAQRIVWGWAYVSTEKGALLTDLQGDSIEPVEMVKMANAFMESVRTAKAMHAGEGIGEVIHSLPLTTDLAKALGLDSDREGWIVGMKVHDDDVWKRVQSGEFTGFSIGGKAKERY